MVLIFLISFYIGLSFEKKQILPDYYFVEFEKKSFIYGLGGKFGISNEEHSFYKDKFKQQDISISIILKTGIKKKIFFKKMFFNFLIFLNPAYKYSFEFTELKHEDGITKYRNCYSNIISSNLIKGVELPFKIKDFDLKARIETNIFSLGYENILTRHKEGDNKISERDERIRLSSQILEGLITFSLLIEI